MFKLEIIFAKAVVFNRFLVSKIRQISNLMVFEKALY